ncbi:glutathione S-transferase family protein [Belnapia sp. T6]|uniref:Glutathione S-transferase family protein n=1 Tax=Belnapia mucosa TaxID=2804532 RepID=A0ABS1UWP7_9PROT|nr:glutathione S-transferase family protein [Belnapia mucosa]MBL6453896.1 glutathione S-transferase family protein [Belnapia mucosa]
MARQLFELCGTDPARRFSPYCWRSRMALAHKGLEAEVVPWRFTEKAAIAFAESDKVPVLVDGERRVADSWAIAEYLDAAYPDAPRLFAGAPAAQRFVNTWSDGVLLPALAKLIVSDIPPLLGAEDRAYFIESREKRFGQPLDQVTAGREARLPEFRALLMPLRLLLRAQPFLGGAAPDYGDYCVFGTLMWPRIVSPLPLLEPGDAVHAWQERMLDLFGGLARAAPAAAA